MINNKQISASIKKALEKFDFSNLQERCSNEAQTRFVLIEPILEILGYSRIDDLATEFNAGWGQKNDRADIGVYIDKTKKPQIIIECKKYGKTLTDKEASQLNSYFVNTEHSKIAILTNGMEWRFYCQKEVVKGATLHMLPFLVIDFGIIDLAIIDSLTKFHKNCIDINQILEEAQEIFFLEGFSGALANELSDPSDDFIKAIFNRMDGKRLTDKLKAKIKNLVNSGSIQDALPTIMEIEMKRGTNIVITTAEELKIYHSVKTILLQSIKKVDSSRISYRDQKNSFNIIADDNNRKIIAKILSNKNKHFIEINGASFEVNDLENIVSLKKQIIESAQVFFES
jgi:hypothetical protein